jgi:hypothetical protein
MNIREIGVPLREGKKVTHTLFTEKEKYMYFKGEYLYFAYGCFGYIGDFLIYDKRRKEFNSDNNWSVYIVNDK